MITISTPIETVADGLTLTEGPRWHGGRLYFSDMHAQRICAVDEAGRLETVVKTDDMPSGIGFMPDGDMLFVLMRSHKVMRFSRGRISLHADLDRFADARINDMAVGPTGRAYVGQLGFEFEGNDPRKTTTLVVIEPDGEARVAASDLWGPNGIALSADGRTLYTAEASDSRITAFDMAADGSLSNRRTFAVPPEHNAPDGICLDSQGGIWAGLPVGAKAEGLWGLGFVRMEEGSRATHRIPVPSGRRAIACCFGGDDRKTLYLCTVDTFKSDEILKTRGGRIERLRLDFTGAGTP
ncbi:MAG TPA: SMP-30/gluconolactonase/LRE family protein [Alphaproteobacteria bacterium]|nr:SMP-30/gluconolactonase/LRE family protein [Alphaproteobacteria bacterium]